MLFLSSSVYKNEPIVKFEPVFCKKVNPFSKKSEPILQNEPIRILYPFRSSFTKKGLSQMLIIKRMAQPFAMKYCY